MKPVFYLVMSCLQLGAASASYGDARGKVSPLAERDSTKTIYMYAASSGYSAQDASGVFSIDIDQDFFLDWLKGKNHDQNYTQGTALSYSKYGLEKSILFAPMNLLGKLLRDTDDEKKITRFPSAIAMGVSAFTPRDIADSLNPVIGDRPFSNVVFLTTMMSKYNSRTRLFTTTSFSYGIIGSNVGNVFQSNAHTVIKGRPTNIGWQYQVSEGGHPAFLFSHSAMRSIADLKLTPKNTVSTLSSPDTITKASADLSARKAAALDAKSWLQLSLGYRINLGWYTGIAGIATLRLGLFSKFSNIAGINSALSAANKAPEFGEITTEDGTKVKTVPGKEFRPRSRVDFYFFGTGSPRLTPYNSLLLGQPWVRSVYTLPKENYNPFVVDFEAGLLVSWLRTVPDMQIPLKNIDLVLSLNGRTSEIVSKDPKVHNQFQRTHYWGRVSVRFPLF